MAHAARRLGSKLPLRHFLSIADLSSSEFGTLVKNAAFYKNALKTGKSIGPLAKALSGETVGLTFNKRSTRTRISTEGAVVALGGHPMFLGKDDIQLGVNESLRDTAQVMSSMLSCIVARVGPHSDVEGLAKYSTVPVINALSDKFHPFQAVADFQTIVEQFGHKKSGGNLGIQGLKIAWIGDANNVLYDMAIAAAKSGVDVNVATPKGYEIPEEMRSLIKSSGDVKLFETTVPEEAVKGADILVTDTWISMGQEAESAKRLKDFAGYQITNAMAKRGGANPGWKFMHCLPRHQEEVADEVFYAENSVVFDEAENRLWAALSVLDAFVVKQGEIVAAS
jgi:ornithine carbamoyltransferase